MAQLRVQHDHVNSRNRRTQAATHRGFRMKLSTVAIISVTAISIFLIVSCNLYVAFTIKSDHHAYHNKVYAHHHDAQQNCCSACLLVMDDNHFLPEWLAYHWHVLPLRRLIVAVDSKSATSPRQILERWDGLINITLWNDAHFLYPSDNASGMKGSANATTTSVYGIVAQAVPNPRRRKIRVPSGNVAKGQANQNHRVDAAPTKPDASQTQQSHRRLLAEEPTEGMDHMRLKIHRYRQRKFMSHCMKMLHHEGYTWTAILDTDEFITVNSFAQLSSWNPFRWFGWNASSVLRTEASNHRATIHSLFERASAYLPKFKQPCIILPRLLISPKRSQIATQQSTLSAATTTWQFNHSQFLTLSYTHSGDRNAATYNGPGKGFVDVSRINVDQHLTMDQMNPHRPIYNLCAAQDVWTPNKASPFVIHHYIGTYDQWSFRNDPRKVIKETGKIGMDSAADKTSVGTRTWQQYKHYADTLNQHTDNSIHDPLLTSDWLQDFVDDVGIEKARHLLQGVGELSKVRN